MRLLNSIYELLSDPHKWCKGAAARSYYGSAIPPRHPRSCQWCLTGALELIVEQYYISKEEDQNARQKIYQAIITLDKSVDTPMEHHSGNFHINETIIKFNDHPYTSHDDIMEVLVYARRI